MVFVRWRLLLTLALLATLARGAEGASRALPAPTGELPIGRVTYYWSDSSRGESTSGGAQRRQLRVDVWYPAQPSATDARAPYCVDLARLQKPFGAEAFLWGSLATHAFADAPIAHGTARYPLVLVTPGHGMNAAQYTALIEELVSHGYVVAGVDHPLQSRAIVYPDGRVVTVVEAGEQEPADRQKSLQDYRDRVEARSADLRFALDQLQRLDAGQPDARFAGRLDLARVGVLGHSLGGVAAAEACHDDPRFKAAVNLDGHADSLPFVLDDSGRGPRQPFMELTDAAEPPTDKQLAQWKITREELERQREAGARRAAEAMRTVAAGSYRATIPGMRHLSFSDWAVWDPGTPEERHRRIQITRDYVRAFFDKTLLGQEPTILDAESSPYADVKLERFRPER